MDPSPIGTFTEIDPPQCPRQPEEVEDPGLPHFGSFTAIVFVLQPLPPAVPLPHSLLKTSGVQVQFVGGAGGGGKQSVTTSGFAIDSVGGED